MKYYSILRPISLGTFPKYDNNKILEIVNFSEKVYCDEIERDAFGYIDYENSIETTDAYNYDLVRGIEKC